MRERLVEYGPEEKVFQIGDAGGHSTDRLRRERPMVRTRLLHGRKCLGQFFRQSPKHSLERSIK